MRPVLILTRARVIAVAVVLAVVAVTLYFSQNLWQSANAIRIAPHQALYQLTLTRLHQANNIADVRGQMSYRIEDACDGWNVAQKFDLQFVYTEASAALITSDYNTYESKDGRHYQFSTRRMHDGQLTDEILGKAERRDPLGNGVIDYQKPKVAQAVLPADVLFPTQHTLALLRAAAEGKTWFHQPLFDGSDLSLATDVSAFIGHANKPYVVKIEEIVPIQKLDADDGDDSAAAETPPTIKPMTAAELNANPLIADTRAWRLRMAFYPRADAIPAEDKDKSDAAADIDPEDDPANAITPDYEMTMVLHSNGVVSSMTLDYPDFSLDARLLSIAEVARNSC